jgi:hypothetical protein
MDISSKWKKSFLSTGMYVIYQTIICHLFAYVQVVAHTTVGLMALACSSLKLCSTSGWFMLVSIHISLLFSHYTAVKFPLILPHVSTHFIHNATYPKSCHEALEELYQNSSYLFITQIIKYNMRRKETVHYQLMSNSKSPGKMSYAWKCCCHFAVAVWIFLRSTSFCMCIWLCHKACDDKILILLRCTYFEIKRPFNFTII